MVRSYLIENRICYKSDGVGVGGDDVDRSDPRAMAAREKTARETLGYGGDEGRDKFAALAASDTFSSIRKAERAAAERQARRGMTTTNAASSSGVSGYVEPDDDLSAFGGAGGNIPNASTAASRQAALSNLLIQGTGNENIDGTNVLRNLEIRAESPFGGARAGNIAEMAFSMDPNVVPVVNAKTNMIVGYQDDGRYTGRSGFNPVQSGFYGGQGIYGNRGRFDDETGAFFIDPLDPSSDSPDEQSDIVEMERLRRLQAEQEQIADPGTTTPEQIDDLAVNYLQSPYFNYSGPGNLFQPYGYAGNTLVDLLQTRNMTMPDEASPNLNLFGNPTDFR